MTAASEPAATTAWPTARVGSKEVPSLPAPLLCFLLHLTESCTAIISSGAAVMSRPTSMSRRKPIQRAAGAGRGGWLLTLEAWRAAVNISGSSCPFISERSSAAHHVCLSGGSVRPPWPTHPPTGGEEAEPPGAVVGQVPQEGGPEAGPRTVRPNGGQALQSGVRGANECWG